MEKDLEGKTALVTGSGRNIGRAIALELAAKGADVVVNARTNEAEAASVADEVRALGARALVVLGDVSQKETVDELTSRALSAFGRVDILVSNAAVRPYQSFLDMDATDWTSILDTQLTASFLLAKAMVPGMIEAGWGRIIHVTGPDAFIGVSHRAHNVAAKGGLRALTKALAIELGPKGITVNDVAPGAINTIRNEASHPHLTKEGAPEENTRTRIIDRIPVGRLGEPEDVAYACGFLASPRAGFFTGTVLCCFGGQWNVG
jgi:NAD(P)-dependent dehydrogenase (short-subunit alcohol dehydrogenase family)